MSNKKQNKLNNLNSVNKLGTNCEDWILNFRQLLLNKRKN